MKAGPLLVVLAAAVAGIPRDAVASPHRADLLVVAPHPDDEILMTAGVLRRAVLAGQRAVVAIVTNGDHTCARDGYRRQRESVAALALLGISESQVHFLGYPDGYLASLGAHLLGPVPRRAGDGSCVAGNTTYGTRGAGGADAHSVRTGQPAIYTAAALVEDLVAAVSAANPRDIYVTHGIDEHPDHASTYGYLRRALDAADRRDPVRVHRFVVHAGACWPNGRPRTGPCPGSPFDPGTIFPPLPDPLAAYAPAERIPVPPEMRASEPGANLKFRVIAAHSSQTGAAAVHDWLAAFARSDEVFYPETLVRDPLARGRLVRAYASGIAQGVASARGPWRRIGPLADGQRVAPRGVVETRAVVQRPPLSYHFGLACDRPATGAALQIMAADRAMRGYELRPSDDGTRLVLTREDGTTRTTLRTLPLPDGNLRIVRHDYEMRLDPRPDDGGALEITLWRDGVFLGVAVDTAPLPVGERIVVQHAARCGFTHVSAAAVDPSVSQTR